QARMSQSDALRSSLSRLRSPISDQEELVNALSIPLELLGLVATTVQQEKAKTMDARVWATSPTQGFLSTSKFKY
ncbi:hypothetical protein FRC16_004308, partial [Serendipita sp. 398]